MLDKLFGGLLGGGKGQSLDTDSIIDSNWGSIGGIFNTLLSFLSGLPVIGGFFQGFLKDNGGDAKATAKSLAKTFVEGSGEPDIDGNPHTNKMEEEAVIALDAVADKLSGDLQTKVTSLIDKIESGKLNLAAAFESSAARSSKDLSNASELARAVESAFKMRGGNEERIVGRLVAYADDAEMMDAPAAAEDKVATLDPPADNPGPG